VNHPEAGVEDIQVLGGGEATSVATPLHSQARPAEKNQNEKSEVLFIEDLAKVLRTSRSTIERRRRSLTLPIPELPSLDKRPRWSRQAVANFLARTTEGMAVRRGRPRRAAR